MDIYIKPNARHGSLERARANEILDSKLFNVLNKVIEADGLVIEKDVSGPIGNDWLVQKISSNQISIQPGAAIVRSTGDKLRYVENEAVQTVTVYNSTIKIYVVLQYEATNYEQGTITLTNGSATVIGDGTEFTKVLAANRRIFVDGTPYTVLSVQSATQCTLASSYSGSTVSDVKYKVGAWFTSYPSGESDNLLYEYDSFRIVLKTSAPSAGDLYLADVNVTSGVIQSVTDKRSENILEYRKTTEFGVRHNLIRNGSFIRPGWGDYGPFRSNNAVAVYDQFEDRDAGGYCKITTDGDESYSYIGQKINLHSVLRKSSYFSLGFQIGCSNPERLNSITVSVYAWNVTSDVNYSTIESANGLSAATNRVLHVDLLSEGIAEDYKQGTKVFEKFIIPASTSTIYVQVRLNDQGDDPAEVILDNFILVEGEHCPYWTPHPEDYMELREINRAAYIVNQLFEIGESNKILLKKSIFGLKNPNSTDDATANPILDAINAKANTTDQATNGTGHTVEEYKYYNDNQV